MDVQIIQPMQKPIQRQVTVPGSKSLTQRALIVAALAVGDSQLINPLASEDTAYTMTALRAMGIQIDDNDPSCWYIKGDGGQLTTPNHPIELGNNGTATRFLTSVAALGNGDFKIQGDARMAERPIGPLIDALQGWGGELTSQSDHRCPPLKIKAKGLTGGETSLPEGKSSQYLSSLLLVAPYARQAATLNVQGPVLSKPYVSMTLAVMNAFGIQATNNESMTAFQIPKGHYTGQRYPIEGDASGASYFWAMAAITGSQITINNVPHPSLQGDAQLVGLLRQMGCQVNTAGPGISVQGPTQLKAIETDMGDMPDVAPTLAVVAAFATGKTVINNIAHLRIKECDRIHAMATELGKIGVCVVEEEDRMIIHGCSGQADKLQGAEIETYNDHRIAMCFGVAAQRVANLRITNPACTAKSFPDFWQRLAALT